MSKKLLLSALAFLCLNQIFAQCDLITNPSFEGLPSYTLPPPNWTSCDTDGGGKYALTFPLNNYDTLSAYNGQSYLGLFYNSVGTVTPVYGSVTQKLDTTMIPGKLYNLGVYLINFDPNTNNTEGFGHFEVWAGYASCDLNTKIFDTSAIPGTYDRGSWQNYSFAYYASDPFTYITLRVNSAALTQNQFWLGVDSFTLTTHCDTTTTGIQEIAASVFAIYPNPVTGTVTIQSLGYTPYTFGLYDLTGREVMPAKELSGTGAIDLGQIAKGIYLARIVQGDRYYSQKLVVE